MLGIAERLSAKYRLETLPSLLKSIDNVTPGLDIASQRGKNDLKNVLPVSAGQDLRATKMRTSSERKTAFKI